MVFEVRNSVSRWIYYRLIFKAMPELQNSEQPLRSIVHNHWELLKTDSFSKDLISGAVCKNELECERKEEIISLRVGGMLGVGSEATMFGEMARE